MLCLNGNAGYQYYGSTLNPCLSGAVCAANYKYMMKLCLLVLTIFLVNSASSQEKSVMTGTMKQDQDLTVVRGQLEDLRAQVTAVEREIARRLNCQKQMQVSTAAGCIPIPSLAQAILDRL
jgi:hypothetical protein